ncbi:hypothetical protein ACFQ06_14430, partial [Tessaracoccus lubricantis]
MNDETTGAELRFDPRQLQARIDGPDPEDPWGAADADEYAVPTEVTGAEDEKEREERRRRRAGGMALRGSGTRG